MILSWTVLEYVAAQGQLQAGSLSVGKRLCCIFSPVPVLLISASSVLPAVASDLSRVRRSQESSELTSSDIRWFQALSVSGRCMKSLQPLMGIKESSAPHPTTPKKKMQIIQLANILRFNSMGEFNSIPLVPDLGCQPLETHSALFAPWWISGVGPKISHAVTYIWYTGNTCS